jgi:hypothetical protein
MTDSAPDSNDLERLRAEVKAAWDKLPPQEQAVLDAKMRAAHAHFLAVQAGPKPRRELVALHNVLHDNLVASPARPDVPAAQAAAAQAAEIEWPVDPDGEVKDPFLQYSAADPRWARTFVAWESTKSKGTPQFKVGNTVQIADSATLWILGDWGGANAAAASIGTLVGAQVANPENYVIHLGDVYYAGTNASDLTYAYESSNLVDVWPGGANQSFTLNSNHEMYAHDTGYVGTALSAPVFNAQGGNCFALYNNTFRIVGLDSAYYAPDQSFDGFMQGTLGPAGGQMQFLQGQIGQLTAGQTLILLTHHNGLNFDGSIPSEGEDPYQLWQDVTQAVQQLPAAANQKVWWYYGHEHAGIVYPPQAVPGTGITILPRCCGHSCIPWGLSTTLAAAQQAGTVTWFENKVLGPQTNYLVANGYASLALSGTTLTESFWNQLGTVSWPSAQA